MNKEGQQEYLEKTAVSHAPSFEGIHWFDQENAGFLPVSRFSKHVVSRCASRSRSLAYLSILLLKHFFPSTFELNGLKNHFL